MTGSAALDPLAEAQCLLDHISGKDGSTPTLRTLAERLDAFMYALRFVLQDSVACVPEFETDRPSDYLENYGSWRNIIGPRFPDLGLYWKVLSSCITDKMPRTGTGDAIDDLADIAQELTIVESHLNAYGRKDALSALRAAYEIHLYMHVLPLRDHVEELIFE